MNLYSKLFDWQKNIVDKFKDRNSFGLFLDMGLGKTIIGLAMAEVNNCDKILVISINSKVIEDENVKGSWLNWAKQSKFNYVFRNKNSKEFEENKPELMIINYESLFERGKNKTQKVVVKKVLQEFILSCIGHKTAVIIDESHKLKDLQSQQTCAVNKIIKDLKHVSLSCKTYLLTGTPFTTGYIDLYSQLKILGYECTKSEFIDNYCIRGNLPGLLGWQQPIIGYKNLDNLYNLIHKFAITIKSEEVICLPEKIFIDHVSPMSNVFKLYIQEKAKSSEIINFANKQKIKLPEIYYQKDIRLNNPFYRNIDYPQEKWLAETSGNFWLRCRELSIGFQGNAEEFTWYDKSRLNDLEKFLKESEENYLLFYNYTPELIEIYDICEKLGYNIDVYCGEAKSLIFYERFSNLSESEKLVNKKNIILANFSSGSTGMNWQEYHHCILFSCPLYKDFEQGIKRIHRTGQKETTFYHRFYQNNFLDNNMMKALNQQITYDKNMFDSDIKRIQEILNKE